MGTPEYGELFGREICRFITRSKGLGDGYLLVAIQSHNELSPASDAGAILTLGGLAGTGMRSASVLLLSGESASLG